MSDWMRRVLESKRALRARLAALPFAEKIAILEKLRVRSLAIADGRAKLVQGTFGRRVLVAPPGAPPMTAERIKAILEAEA